MKKIIALALALIMTLSFAACDAKGSGSKKDSFGIPGEDLNTLRQVFNDGYEDSGRMISENVFAQEVSNANGEEYILIVKVPEESMEAFEAIDFLADDATEQYLDLIGDIEFTASCNKADFMPEQEFMDAIYVGMTVGEFEMGGASLSGYSGDFTDDMLFFFDDGTCEYRVELEDGAELEECDDMEAFDAAIRDCKIGKIACDGLTMMFTENYMDQFLDPPELAPKELGDGRASLDEINSEIGCDIKGIEGAEEEKFSIIGGKIAQYTYCKDGYYYCIRSSADMTIDLSDDDFGSYSLVDKEGYVTTVSGQDDLTRSYQFVFDGYQYAYIVYDGGAFDYMEWNTLQKAYQNAVCVYPEDSPLKPLLGTYSSEDGYTISGSPVAEDTVQVAAYTFDDTKTTLWTMLVKESDGKLSYDKSMMEIYMQNGEGNPAPSDAGSGTFTVQSGTITWNDHVFKIENE